MGLALGLGAALCWGVADYVVAVTARTVGALRVAIGFHLAALIPLGVLTLCTGALDPVSWPQVLGFVLIGLFGWLSYLTFYRALQIGPISLVSPIVSGYAAITVVLAAVLVGEHVSVAEAGAIIVTFLGVVLSGTDLSALHGMRIDRRAAQGIGLAVLAMVMFGAFIFGVSEHRSGVGWLAPIFLGRLFSTLFLLVHGWRRGALREPVPSAARLGLIGLIAVLDTSGYVLFNLGVRHAATPVVATASAPYALVPVALGVKLLRERPSRIQWVGLSVVCVGLVLLGAEGG